MPATPAELRSLLIQLSDNAVAELAALWAQLDAQTVGEGLFDVLPALVGDYGDAAANLSAEWYVEHRYDLNVSGSFTAEPAEPDLGANALAGWGTSLAADNYATALPLISGGLIKRVMTASRDTLTVASHDDPEARGWQRAGRGECDFCRLLIGRGAVYTRKTVNFGAHDNCKCTAVPAFGGRPIPVEPYKVTDRDITDADRARVRQWIADNQ